jgi:hypothetical protein
VITQSQINSITFSLPNTTFFLVFKKEERFLDVKMFRNRVLEKTLHQRCSTKQFRDVHELSTESKIKLSFAGCQSIINSDVSLVILWCLRIGALWQNLFAQWLENGRINRFVTLQGVLNMYWKRYTQSANILSHPYSSDRDCENSG